MGDLERIAWRLGVVVVLLAIVAMWATAAPFAARWDSDKQTKVACLTARADPVVHAYCVKNGFDR